MGQQRVGVAVLTMGNRPAELTRLLDSVAAQDTPATRVVVVGNGTPLPALPDGVTGVELPENLGVSGGRNVALDRLPDVGLSWVGCAGCGEGSAGGAVAPAEGLCAGASSVG